ncbi:hypothetical protein [Oceanimonas smirnovii]|uniref:hypothetical protein n=1 Tax=Oceanimonas smirnovii TaxID=264574 RepID=UPI00146154D5|nr:hypothetical protein [Oceanimonas smirnovii]
MIFIAVVIVLFLYLYPAQVTIHYPYDKPIHVELIQYDRVVYRARTSNQIKRIALKKSNVFTWHFTENQFADLLWWFDDSSGRTLKKGMMIGDVIEFLKACRIDVYLNEAAEVESVDVKETQFLNFCF